MKKNRLYLTEEDCNVLMRVTADMLAMPQLVCHRKNCHRKRRCDRVMTRTCDPACVHSLPPAQRAVFDALYRTVILIADDISDAYPSRDPEKRALEEAAIESSAPPAPAVPTWRGNSTNGWRSTASASPRTSKTSRSGNAPMG